MQQQVNVDAVVRPVGPRPLPLGGVEFENQTRMLYTRQESARQLSLSVRSLDYLIGSKQLTARRVGKRVLITHGELVRFSRGDHPDAVRTQ
jgi:hypothetical protein